MVGWLVDSVTGFATTYGCGINHVHFHNMKDASSLSSLLPLVARTYV